MEEERWRSPLWLITKNNTENRDDHCAQHTNTLSYHKHFKMHKVAVEVGICYLGGREEFVVCFRDPPP